MTAVEKSKIAIDVALKMVMRSGKEMTNEEIRKAIDKYQKEHPLHFGTMVDVTAINSKEGADIISQTVERISKKVEEDTELWCICEMAKMYMRGVKPVYPARMQGEWIEVKPSQSDLEDGIDYREECSICHEPNRHYEFDDHDNIISATYYKTNFCPNCGADMRGGVKND